MNRQLNFNDERAKAERDAAIDHVADRRRYWMAVAVRAIQRIAFDPGRSSGFTSDDVLKAAPELEQCPELRVLGAAFRLCCKRGLIVPGAYRASSRVASHGRPKREWIRKSKWI